MPSFFTSSQGGLNRDSVLSSSLLPQSQYYLVRSCSFYILLILSRVLLIRAVVVLIISANGSHKNSFLLDQCVKKVDL